MWWWHWEPMGGWAGTEVVSMSVWAQRTLGHTCLYSPVGEGV